LDFAQKLNFATELLYAPVNALLDAVHQAHLPVLYTNQWLRPDNALFKAFVVE
jgi:hypothetical protein